MYKIIDLFSGCGGLTLGFTGSGFFESVLAVESNVDAAETYDTNFGRHVVRDTNDLPIRIEDLEEFPNADLIIGGPPCQGFSALNMRGIGPERRGLWREYLRALEHARPVIFLMENVPQLLRSAEYADFKTAASRLGYHVDQAVLNAADYGVPQTRRRAIALGSLLGPPPWPAQTHFPPGAVPHGKLPWRTFRDAVSEPMSLPAVPTGENWHNPRNPTLVSVERYRTIPDEGEGRFELAARRPDITPGCWLRKTTGSADVFGRLWWDRPSSTIRTEFYKPEKGRYLHPQEDRPITVREAARCQSFPDDFAFPAMQSMTSVSKQIGNAVAPLLAERLANVLAAHLSEAALPIAA